MKTISNIVTSNVKRETLQTLLQISTEARYKQWKHVVYVPKRGIVDIQINRQKS